MAKSVISGLTVTIGADTKGFTSAIKEIDAQARALAKDLKLVNQSLKIDPGDAESYADKMKLLQQAASNASTKVDVIKQAIEKLNKQFATSEANAKEYAKAVAEVNEAHADGKVSDEDYKRILEDIDKTYQKGTITQQEYEKELKKLEQRLESATREQHLAVNALDEYQRETKDAAVQVDNLGDETKETAEQTNVLGDAINKNVLSGAIKKGFESIVSLAKSLARHLAEAAKDFAKFTGEAVSMAASYEDALGYADTIFGEKTSGQVKQWVDENSNALRIYKGDLLENVNTFGQLFQTMGLGSEESFGMATNILSLAADLRAATGKDTGDILESLTAGFTNTTRTLRQFGVRINEAEIKAYALDNGIVKVSIDQTKLADKTLKVREAAAAAEDALAKYGEESLEYERACVNVQKAEDDLNKLLEGKVDSLTAAERTTAIYRMMLEQLAPVIGQNERESGLFNSQLAELKTRFQNLKLEIGNELLPIATELINKVNKFLESEKGQELLATITDQFAKLADEIGKLIEDGTLNDLVNKFIESAPQIVSDIGNIVKQIIDLTPEVLDLTEKLLALFGIKTEAYEAKEAFVAVQDELVLFANQYNISTEDAEKAIKTFAAQNGVHVSQIYKDWESWEPQINEWMGTLSTDTTTMTEAITTEYEKIPEELQNEVDDIKNTDLSGWDEFAINYTTKIAEFATTMANAWNQYCQPVVDWIRAKISWVSEKFDDIFGHDWETDTSLIDQSTPDYLYGDDPYRDPFRASGGPVKAGRMYRVNDNAGHQTEWYIPGQNGYILNGNQVDRIVNNNHSSNYSGGINIYVNSYGMNVAEVADELGAAFSQRIRKSGAML